MNDIDPDRYRSLGAAGQPLLPLTGEGVGRKDRVRQGLQGEPHLPVPTEGDAWLMRKIKSFFNLPTAAWRRRLAAGELSTGVLDTSYRYM